MNQMEEDVARRHLAHSNGLPAYLAAIFTLFLISCLVRLATAGAGVDKVEDDVPVILLESSTGPKNREWSNLEGPCNCESSWKL